MKDNKTWREMWRERETGLKPKFIKNQIKSTDT